MALDTPIAIAGENKCAVFVRLICGAFLNQVPFFFQFNAASATKLLIHPARFGVFRMRGLSASLANLLGRFRCTNANESE